MLFQRCVIAFVLILSLSTILHNPVEAISEDPQSITGSDFGRQFCNQCSQFGATMTHCYTPSGACQFSNVPGTCDVCLIYCTTSAVRPASHPSTVYAQSECYACNGFECFLSTFAFSGVLPAELAAFLGTPYGITGAALGTAALASPSSLGLIGGLGFPNPGFTLAGGGVLPTAILSVCK